MDSGNEPPILGEFDALFKRSVPHILEKIIFPLDYDSFRACSKVCKVWADLLSSESYVRKSEELLKEKEFNEESMYQFSKFGTVKGVAQLLSCGVNPNCEKAHASLSYAAKKGHTEVVKLLLSAGTDYKMASVQGEPLMVWATRHRHRDVVQALLDAGSDPIDEYRKRFTTINPRRRYKVGKFILRLEAWWASYWQDYGTGSRSS